MGKKHNNDCRDCKFFLETCDADVQGHCSSKKRFKSGEINTHVYYDSEPGCKFWKRRKD